MSDDRLVLVQELTGTIEEAPVEELPAIIGQLEQMKKQEVIDLIKYLRTTEQVEMAK